MCDVLSKKMHRKKPKNSGTEMEEGGRGNKKRPEIQTKQRKNERGESAYVMECCYRVEQNQDK